MDHSRRLWDDRPDPVGGLFQRPESQSGAAARGIRQGGAGRNLPSPAGLRYPPGHHDCQRAARETGGTDEPAGS